MSFAYRCTEYPRHLTARHPWKARFGCRGPKCQYELKDGLRLTAVSGLSTSNVLRAYACSACSLCVSGPALTAACGMKDAPPAGLHALVLVSSVRRLAGYLRGVSWVIPESRPDGGERKQGGLPTCRLGRAVPRPSRSRVPTTCGGNGGRVLVSRKTGRKNKIK